jgi:carbamoyl-phosphate synthase small subunit
MIEELIAKAGGKDVVAAGCRVSTDALRKWIDAGAVPARHWPWFAATLGWSLDRVMKSAVDQRAA